MKPNTTWAFNIEEQSSQKFRQALIWTLITVSIRPRQVQSSCLKSILKIQEITVGIRLSALQLPETSSYRTFFTSLLTERSSDNADHLGNGLLVQ